MIYRAHPHRRARQVGRFEGRQYTCSSNVWNRAGRLQLDRWRDHVIRHLGLKAKAFPEDGDAEDRGPSQNNLRL
jgi:hypothetical protein